jgi:hypothetical protein
MRTMLLCAQIDPTDVIQHASDYSWEAGLLALIVVSSFVSFGWMMKVIMQRHLAVEERILNDARDREARLAARVTMLEDLVRSELINLIRSNGEMSGKMLSAMETIIRASERMIETLVKFTNVLDVRPCLLSAAEQLRLANIAVRTAEALDKSSGK